MTSTLDTDKLNDLSLDANGQISIASGRDAYEVILRAVMSTLLGEIQLDTRIGIPYLEYVMRSSASIDTWEVIVRQKITAYGFVVAIKSFDISSVGGKMSYRLVVITDDGEVSITQ